MKSFTITTLAGLFAAAFLSACGKDHDPSPSGNVQPSSESIQVSGAGIKGPLAFADAKIFAVDPAFSDFYDKDSPISAAVTDQYAQISGLSVPADIDPPFILTIGGNQAIDLNTGKRPVISTLVTVITSDKLASQDPVYASPLTTLVFHMARHAARESGNLETFLQELNRAIPEVSDKFSINADKPINVLSSPLVINASTDTQAKQELAIYHRAAVEAFATKIYQLSQTQGDGLQATYYSDSNLSKVAIERIDTSIDFNWQGGSPANGLDKDNFSVRWTGLVSPEYSEQYTFYTSTDDGVRLWVGGQLLIDQWSNQYETEYSALINLTAGKKYPITVEYYDNIGGAAAKLAWSSTSQLKSIVPQANLYSATDSAEIDNLTPDIIIDRLALDLQSDGVIDNSAHGAQVGGIDPTVLNRSPANLLIPNTSDRIRDIITVMDKERVLIGTDPLSIIQVNSIEFIDTPTLKVSAPVDDSNPTTISINTPPPGTPSLDTPAKDATTSVISSSNLSPVLPAKDPVQKALGPVLTLSRESIKFTNQLVGSMSDSRQLLISNDGDAPLNISGIKLSSSKFIETNSCSNYLTAGQSCAIEIKFIPVSVGITQGRLEISGSSSVSPYVVNLAGTGIDGSPPAEVNASSACTATDAIFCIDHNNIVPGHHVTDADITDWFLADQGRAGIINDKTGGAIDIVADPTGDPARGNVMRIFNSKGARGFTDGINGPSSGQWRSWPGEHNELYFSYDFYMEPGRAWTKGQKLPGLTGGNWAVGSGGSKGGTPDGTNGFSARLMMFSKQAYPGKGNGALAQYTYYTDTVQSPKWYNAGPGGQVNLEPGKWYTIESYIKLNTPGVANGLMKAWVNGVQVLNHKQVKWRTVNSLKIDGVFFTFGYGGGDDSWNASEDQYNYFDNWILSTQPISH